MNTPTEVRPTRVRRIRRWARRRWQVVTAGLVVVALLVGFGLYWFQPWKLWTNHRVDEAIPGGVVAVATASDLPLTQIPATSSGATTTIPTTPAAPAGPVVLARSSFVSKEHSTSGEVLLLALVDGSKVVRFEGLDTSDGPDLRVILSPAAHTAGWYDFGRGSHELSALKGNQGNQNYSVPTDLDLSRFRSVVIWCDRFSVAFGAAELAR